MKRIWVISGTGFVCPHLCKHLIEAGHKVLCVDNYHTGSRRKVDHLNL